MEKNESLFALVRVFLGDAATTTLCVSNDHTFQRFIDEYQAQLPTFSRQAMWSMLTGTSVNPMIPVDHQTWSPYKKRPNREVSNDMHLCGFLLSKLQGNVQGNVSNGSCAVQQGRQFVFVISVVGHNVHHHGLVLTSKINLSISIAINIVVVVVVVISDDARAWFRFVPCIVVGLRRVVDEIDVVIAAFSEPDVVVVVIVGLVVAFVFHTVGWV